MGCQRTSNIKNFYHLLPLGKAYNIVGLRLDTGAKKIEREREKVSAMREGGESCFTLVGRRSTNILVDLFQLY